MPKGDGKGPRGQGPNTGRGMGTCRSKRERKETGRGLRQRKGTKRDSGYAVIRGQGQDTDTGRYRRRR